MGVGLGKIGGMGGWGWVEMELVMWLGVLGWISLGGGW